MTVSNLRELITSQSEYTLVGGSLSEVIKCGNEVVKLYRGPHQRGYDKLRHEVAYIQSLPEAMRNHYPKILEVIDSPMLYAYKMPYYMGMQSLSDEVFSAAPIQATWGKLTNIIDFMNKSHYPQLSTTDKTEEYVDKIIHQRLAQAHHVLATIPELDEITNGTATIHDTALLPLCDILSSLKTDVFINTALRPAELNLFHGNFHLDNILVSDDSFLLIDPRGETYGSKMYDTCKLFVHLLIRYDEIHLDKFTLNERDKNIEVLLTDPMTGKRYDYLQQRYLESCRDQFGTDFFSNSLLVIGGTHAISFASYHARKPNPCIDRVKAYLGAGMSLLSSYLRNQTVDLSHSLFTYIPESNET